MGVKSGEKENNSENYNDSIKFTTPLFSLEGKGTKIIVYLLVIFGISFPVWALLEHHKWTELRMSQFVETQQALIYMLSLTQEEREKLQINKPKLVREMEYRSKIE